MGVRHVRALIVFLIAAPAFAHEIGTTQVEVVFHRDHTFTATVTGAARVEPEVRFDSALSRVRERAAAQPRVRVWGQVPEGARTFTWRNRRAYSTYSLTIVDECSFAPRSGEKVPKADEGRTLTRRVQWIDADATSAPYALSHTVEPSRTDIIRQYLALGFTHIIPEGLDHILFVLGMFLLTRQVRDVLAQVTAFTTAHSITLGLTMYGAVSVSPRIVEPAIALSIAYIAIENVITTHVRPWRVAVVFCFGLLHGMGFA
ncbi:MAG TPA: HupE/UreJ family protein, partial [Thermoanaerobaculia bacterium]